MVAKLLFWHVFADFHCFRAVQHLSLRDSGFCRQRLPDRLPERYMQQLTKHFPSHRGSSSLSATAASSTMYLSAPDAAELIRRKGLLTCMSGIGATIRANFLRWRDFDKSARVANHSAGGVIELMPISDNASYSFKYVNGHPRNHLHGLPTVMAFGVLADVATGHPQLLSELTLTTALRTAAMSVVAAQELARPDSRTMALIGNGAQSEFQALAFRDGLGITDVRLFDVDAAAMRKLAGNLEGSGLRVTFCRSVAEAVMGADIVTTITADKSNATILTPDMIEPGMHLNAVGGDCPGKTELHPDVLRGAAVFVEYAPQTRVEGDIQQMPADFPVTEMWEVLTGAKPGRVQADQVTVFDSVGFALEDFSALRFMRDTAIALGVGARIMLIPEMRDPKNLFEVLGQERGERVVLGELALAGD
jgi:ornithine cyclodeaminase